MRRSKVLLVLDMHLIYATFLKVDFGTEDMHLIYATFLKVDFGTDN